MVTDWLKKPELEVNAPGDCISANLGEILKEKPHERPLVTVSAETPGFPIDQSGDFPGGISMTSFPVFPIDQLGDLPGGFPEIYLL